MVGLVGIGGVPRREGRNHEPSPTRPIRHPQPQILLSLLCTSWRCAHHFMGHLHRRGHPVGTKPVPCSLLPFGSTRLQIIFDRTLGLNFSRTVGRSSGRPFGRSPSRTCLRSLSPLVTRDLRDLPYGQTVSPLVAPSAAHTFRCTVGRSPLRSHLWSCCRLYLQSARSLFSLHPGFSFPPSLSPSLGRGGVSRGICMSLDCLTSVWTYMSQEWLGKKCMCC